MDTINRKEFIQQVGIGAFTALMATCGIGCKKKDKDKSDDPQDKPLAVDFTIDVSSGSLATNGGVKYQNNILIARTLSGEFLAVSQFCTHQQTSVQFQSATSSFKCPNHGAEFNSTGAVTLGPATANLTKYNTTLNGTSLRVFSS